MSSPRISGAWWPRRTTLTERSIDVRYGPVRLRRHPGCHPWWLTGLAAMVHRLVVRPPTRDAAACRGIADLEALPLNRLAPLTSRRESCADVVHA